MKGIRKIYDKEAIKNAYLEGKSPTTIARELGTYNTTIRRFLLELGIKPRLYKLGIYTNSDVIKIYHKFYNETSIFLERKRLSMARCLSNQAFQPVKVGEPVSGIPSQAPNLLGEGVETRRQAPNSKE